MVTFLLYPLFLGVEYPNLITLQRYKKSARLPNFSTTFLRLQHIFFCGNVTRWPPGPQEWPLSCLICHHPHAFCIFFHARRFLSPSPSYNFTENFCNFVTSLYIKNAKG